MKPTKKRLLHDDALVGKKLKNLLAQEESAMLKALFPEAVSLALNEKRSSPPGLSSVAPVSQKEVDDMAKTMAPLMVAIKKQANASFFRVLSGILKDSVLKESMTHSFSSIAGKKGGRARGKAWHIKWLEEVIRRQERGYLCDATAEDHMEAVAVRTEIDSIDDDGKLVFRSSFLEDNGWNEKTKEPKISINTVREALTRIRKDK